jgi:hypothetical protein
MPNQHGDFVWYELITPDPDAAEAFYGPMLGWSFTKTAHPGRDYRYFAVGDAGVGGIMQTPSEAPMPPAWLGYVGVDDVDKMVESVEQGGGQVHMPAFDLEGIGRMAIVADPQGAAFYVMDIGPEESHAFSWDAPRPGHCAWNELATADPNAAKQFYGQRFGWVKDGEMDMGPIEKYEFLRHTGRGEEGSMHAMLGAVMPKMPDMLVSAWTYYFRVPDIDAAVAHTTANRGRILVEPMEIPGGEFSFNGLDPQGAAFGLVGPRKGE